MDRGAIQPDDSAGPEGVGRRRRLAWLKSVAIVLASLLVALLACEGVLRLLRSGDNVYTTATLGTFASDPELTWVNKPGLRVSREWGGRHVLIRTDGQGRRVPDALAYRADTEPVDAGLIVFAGDSYVFGNEVNAEETFVHLTGQSSPPRRVVNLGVGGYSLGQTCGALLRFMGNGARIGRAYLAVYLGNDIEYGASQSRTLRVDRYGYLRDNSTGALWVANARSFAVRHSRLVFYLGVAWQRLSSGLRSGGSGATQPADRWIYDAKLFTRERLDDHRHVLASLRDAARAQSVPVTVVLIPEKDQVYGSLSDLPNRMMSAMLTDLGMPVIDLLPAMRAARDRPLWNEGIQAHLSPEGHRLVAAILRDDLSRMASE
jgi:hypothetical protein